MSLLLQQPFFTRNLFPLPAYAFHYFHVFRDLSNNSFNSSPAPDWFSTLSSLTALWVFLAILFLGLHFKNSLLIVAAREKFIMPNCLQGNRIWTSWRADTGENLYISTIRASVSFKLCSFNHLENDNVLNHQMSCVNLFSTSLLVRLGFRKLRNNAFFGNLNLSGGVSPKLTLVDLQGNDISAVTMGYPGYTNTLM